MRVQPHDFHPIFFKGSGKSYTSLGQQAAVLRCAVAGVPVTSVPVILDMDDKHVFRLSSNLESARSQHVRQQEKKIKFGPRHAWADVEADEIDLGRPNGNNGVASWKGAIPSLWFIPQRSQDHPPHRWGQNV